jgi:hypothetical protein
MRGVSLTKEWSGICWLVACSVRYLSHFAVKTAQHDSIHDELHVYKMLYKRQLCKVTQSSANRNSEMTYEEADAVIW